jgi:hypothetical protein
MALVLLACGSLAAGAERVLASTASSASSWGAIASVDGWWGYAFNHPSRSAAELAARTQCERSAKRPGACIVRTAFDRSCGALATGNFGEWGTATASTAVAAGKEAAGQCDSHLPTEPCKVVVSVCSPR